MIDAPVEVKTGLGLAMDKLTEISAENGLAEQYAAALDWWRDAGVDQDFADEAQSWLSDTQPVTPIAAVPQKAKAEEAPPPAISQRDVPNELEAFRNWWMDSATPLPAGPGPRVSPRGALSAPIMLIAPMPEMDDREALLSGAQGRMLGNMLRALGLDAQTAYFATALPAHITLPDWDALQYDGLGHALTRHIALVKPARIMLLGSKLPALLGQSADTPPDSFSGIDGIPTLTTFAPDRLLDHPRQRARLWQRLLAWTSQ